MVFSLASLLVTSSLLANDKNKEEYNADLNSGDASLQMEACRYFAEKGDESAVEALIFLLGDPNTDSAVQASAATALGLIGKKENTVDSLIMAARENPSPTVQYASFIALASWQDDLTDEKRQAELKEIIIRMKTSSDPYLSDLATRMIEVFENKK